MGSGWDLLRVVPGLCEQVVVEGAQLVEHARGALVAAHIHARGRRRDHVVLSCTVEESALRVARLAEAHAHAHVLRALLSRAHLREGEGYGVAIAIQ